MCLVCHSCYITAGGVGHIHETTAAAMDAHYANFMLLPSVGEQWCHLYPAGARIHQYPDMSGRWSSRARGCGPAGNPPCCSRRAP